MSWKEIPNEVIPDFTGKPRRSQDIDANQDPVWRETKCYAKACEYKTTSLQAMRDHIDEEHGDEGNITMRAEVVDETAALLVMGLMGRFNRRVPDERGRETNPLMAIHKGNDGMHSTEVWRRAFLAHKTRAGGIKLKPEQYDWLKTLLDRKLPLAKDQKEAGEEQQTVGMHLYGLSDDIIAQRLLCLSERRKPAEPDPEDEQARPAEKATA